MKDEDPSQSSDREGAADRAIEHVKKAEHDLEKAHEEERQAEKELHEAERELEQIEHPHPRETEIIVNSRPKKVPGHEVTFEQVVKIAFPDAQPEQNVVYSMTYRHAASVPHAGELGPGGKVEVKNGTVFNVTKTVQS